MTKVEMMKLFEPCMIDFWGERKTSKKIREAWEDLKNALKEDRIEGEIIPDYKLTNAEVRRLMKG